MCLNKRSWTDTDHLLQSEASRRGTDAWDMEWKQQNRVWWAHVTPHRTDPDGAGGEAAAAREKLGFKSLKCRKSLGGKTTDICNKAIQYRRGIRGQLIGFRLRAQRVCGWLMMSACNQRGDSSGIYFSWRFQVFVTQFLFISNRREMSVTFCLV